MMACCALRSCTSNQKVDKKNTTGITFHRFPHNDPVRLKFWVEFVNRPNWKLTNCSVLCIRHFKEEDIDRTSQCRVRLRSNAVPTLYKPIPITPMKRPVQEDHNYSARNLNKSLSATPKMETISNTVIHPVVALHPNSNNTDVSNEAVSCSLPKIREIFSNNDVPLIVHGGCNTYSWTPSRSISILDSINNTKYQGVCDTNDITPRKKKLLCLIDKIQNVSYSRKKKIDSMRKKIARQRKKIASLKNIIKLNLQVRPLVKVLQLHWNFPETR